MLLQWNICFCLILSVNSKETLKFISRTHTSYLNKYNSYLDTTLLHFNIPSNALFASLKIEVEEKQQSLFSCKSELIELYLKEGSPAVINPDGSKFPLGFVNLSRPEPNFINFTSQSPPQYINLTTPNPSVYFVTAYLAYSDPRNNGIKPQGLEPKCFVYLDVTLYVNQADDVNIIIKDYTYIVNVSVDSFEVSKFFVPENVDHVLLNISHISCNDCEYLNVRIHPLSVPTFNKSITGLDIPFENFSNHDFLLTFWTRKSAWYYIRFDFANSTYDEEVTSLPLSRKGFLNFRLKYFETINQIFNSSFDQEQNMNKTNDTKVGKIDNYVPDPILKLYRGENMSVTMFYNEYDLVRERSSDSFMYAYDLRPRKNGKNPLYFNITSETFITLKFVIEDQTDSGGTAQFHLGFKPRIKYENGKRKLESEPENHKVVGCLRRGMKELPLNSRECFSDGLTYTSPIFINKTVENGSVLIPYPEPGVWYVSLRLFCGDCQPCNCSKSCQNLYGTCSDDCENKCKSEEDCSYCSVNCRNFVLNTNNCLNCDCIGGCQNNNNKTCNSSLIFEISSFSCIDGSCGDNGKCVFAISEGFVLTSCLCSNNYKGWDCSDGSLANSYSAIILEMLLLTLSNSMFIPAVYIAFKRQYYVESLTYLALFLSSTFYHACDAGENIISYCIIRLGVLQFSDFFCAVLSLWVTLIAMAYITEPLVSSLHMIGAITLAFGTTYNKMSLWLFALPSFTGIMIIMTSWFVKYRKLKYLFPSKGYLKKNFIVGIVVVGLGIVTFGFLQTKSNYKYLHSLWHILMAAGIIILLPDKTTFLPSNL